MAAIYLVRHGITKANYENRFAGRTQEELHPDGIAQMSEVGERLRRENIRVIYCGPAKRTVQSAEILGSLLNIPVSAYPGFDEIYIPHWDGLTKDEIRARFNEQYPTWLGAPQTFRLPGCETLEQVQKRGAAGIDQVIAANPGQNMLLVSHLIVLRCLVLYFKGLAIRDFRLIKIANGEIIRISEPEKGSGAVSYLEP